MQSSTKTYLRMVSKQCKFYAESETVEKKAKIRQLFCTHTSKNTKNSGSLSKF